MDIVYVLLILGLFVASIALVFAIDRLGDDT
jgi:hypothetical protein